MNVTSAELEADFDSYLSKVEQGCELIISDHGRAIARLIPAPHDLIAEKFRAQRIDTRACRAAVI